ncbi:DnaD domain protein [Niallia sp. BSM11]|uniref:DnaD domain protein n=1 Tax=Niallia sp. BSM11 TaxID=3391576 RepID=UPI00398543F3
MDNKKATTKKGIGKIIDEGLTEEEIFKELHGMTLKEIKAREEKEFKAKTGMTYDEWYVNEVKMTTPIEMLKDSNGTIKEEDLNLIKDLEALGLNNEVIIVLLQYVMAFSKIGLLHPIVKEMGERWKENNILTVEQAIKFVSEVQIQEKEK